MAENLHPLLATLNPPQREAVLATDGPCLILAGAGSGKTRVLAHRVAWLIESRAADPRDVLALTFTNKAADEMRERVQVLLGAPDLPLFLGTFHSWCVRVLRREAEAAGYRPHFAIYDTADQLAALRRAMEDLRIPEKSFPPRRILHRISAAKNRLQGPEGVAGRDPFAEAAERAFRRYQEILLEANALDFDDLLVSVAVLLGRGGEPAERVQRAVRYILVDEYQDTNHAQYRILRALAAPHRNLAVVGDADQSIYGFRGADIRNILDFKKDFPEARVFRLEQNYRSTRRILAVAQGLIQRNRGRLERGLWTGNPEGDPVREIAAPDERAEAEEVARRIDALRMEFPLDHIAVLYRTNAQSRLLEESLGRRRIPHLVVGGVRFYERREIKDVLAYLALAVNPDDSAALSRIVNVPSRGIGEKTLDGIRERSRRDGVSLHRAIEATLEGPATEAPPARARAALAAFRDLVARIRAETERRGLPDIVRWIVRETGYDRYLETEGPIEAQARRENLDSLASAAAEAAGRGEGAAEFLAGLALRSDQDSLEDGRGVLLMTLHTAKGLEFDVVFLVGLEENLLPHANSANDDSEVEEERRLCYVGMTRARRQLFLAWAFQRTVQGAPLPRLRSRFLDELPAELLDRGEIFEAVREAPAPPWRSPRPDRALRSSAGRRGEEAGYWPDEPSGDDWGQAAPEATRNAMRFFRKGHGTRATASPAPPETSPPVTKPKPPAPPEEASDPLAVFRKGTHVRHPRFGTGQILSIERVRGDLKLTIYFSGYGRKVFMASHAPLTPEPGRGI